MSLQYFYHSRSPLQPGLLELDEDTSRHLVQVLRSKEGQAMRLTDGLGTTANAVIATADKKRTQVRIEAIEHIPATAPRSILGISILKNNNRIEWLLEKAAEMGISEIIPLLCDRTEKDKFRYDRMQSILVSAMLQSQQAWLPMLREPLLFDKLLEDVGLNGVAQRFIAHCLPAEKTALRNAIDTTNDCIVLVGPEGDFTPGEIDRAIDRGYRAVSLGNTRLRTETAGLVAAMMMRFR